MASPDFSEYIDLTIYDLEPVDIYNDAVQYARTALPELEVRAGTVEDALIQAMAYSTALLVGSINRMPDGLMEGILKLMGFSRLEATYSEGSAIFTVDDINGQTIPAGTVIAYEEVSAEGIVTSWTYETLTDLIIGVGSTSGTVNIRAINPGLYPSIFAGQDLVLVSPAAGVLTVDLVSQTAVGTDSESDAQYFTRGSQYLGSLSNALATRTQIQNYIDVNYSTVPIRHVFDLTDDVTESYTAAAAAGWIGLILANSDGTAHASTTAIQNDILDKAIAGLQIATGPAVLAYGAITVNIVVKDGYYPSTVAANVKSALENFYSPTGFPYQETISSARLIGIVSQVEGVQYFSSLTVVDNGGGTILLDGTVTMPQKNAIPQIDFEVNAT